MPLPLKYKNELFPPNPLDINESHKAQVDSLTRKILPHLKPSATMFSTGIDIHTLSTCFSLVETLQVTACNDKSGHNKWKINLFHKNGLTQITLEQQGETWSSHFEQFDRHYDPSTVLWWNVPVSPKSTVSQFVRVLFENGREDYQPPEGSSDGRYWL
jgi:hypothetical protein